MSAETVGRRIKYGKSCVGAGRGTSIVTNACVGIVDSGTTADYATNERIGADAGVGGILVMPNIRFV